MLIVIICTVAGAIILGFISALCFRTVGDALIGGFIGIMCGLLLSLLISLCVAASYWGNLDHYEPTETTYNIEKQYGVDKKDEYYVYLSSSNGNLISNIQYIDDDGTPQLLHLESNTDYIFIEDATATITITEYSKITNPWVLDILSSVPSNEYKIVLPSSDGIKQNLSGK